MPFPYDCSGISGLSEHLRKSLLSTIELISIHEKSIGMRIFPGLNSGSHWPANRVRNIALFKKHTVPGEGIDIRSRAVFFEPGVIGTHGLIGMIIREDKENIWFFGGTQ